MASATAAMARLDRIWKSNISFRAKFKLVPILLFGCETQTLLAESEMRVQASKQNA